LACDLGRRSGHVSKRMCRGDLPSGLQSQDDEKIARAGISAPE
jgi:hypothetical protein